MLNEIKLPEAVRDKIVAGLEKITDAFWKQADYDDLHSMLVGALVYGDNGKLPYVYRSDEELVEALIEYNVDAALELFLIVPSEYSRLFALESIRSTLQAKTG